MTDAPLVTIIIPVRNEAELLRNCLKSIAELDYPKDRLEVIVSDGMSSDGSADVAGQYGAVVVKNEKLLVSPGRNAAFGHAGGEIIAFTDADCIADKEWISNSIKYFGDESVGCVGGPNLTPPGEGAFGRAVGFVFDRRLFAAGSIHARQLPETREVASIPGCNAVYRRAALEKAMPVDETVLTCDDTLLNRKILDVGYRLLYTPDVFVWHFRRPNPKRLFKQMYRYAIGRLQVGRRDRRMINLTHVLVGLSLPLAVLLAVFLPPVFLLSLSVFISMLAAYFLMALFKTGSLKAAVLVPAVITIILFGWSTGFVRELVRTVRRRQ